VGKNTFEEDDEPHSETIIRPVNENATLPYEEYIEFLRDLTDILSVHKNYLLLKMNVFYTTHPMNKQKNDHILK